jgi:hypothetical protein
MFVGSSGGSRIMWPRGLSVKVPKIFYNENNAKKIER